MTRPDISEEIRLFLEAAVLAAETLSTESKFQLNHSHIEEALMLELDIPSSVDLLNEHFDAERIVTTLASFDFSRLFPELLDVVYFEQSIIPDGTTRKLTEVTVRANGEQWRIHKCDADPFPSNPHAHNLSSGLKLHLGSGELYFKKRNTGEKVSRKDLEVIRAKITKHTLPTLTR